MGTKRLNATACSKDTINKINHIIHNYKWFTLKAKHRENRTVCSWMKEYNLYQCTAHVNTAHTMNKEEMQLSQIPLLIFYTMTFC